MTQMKLFEEQMKFYKNYVFINKTGLIEFKEEHKNDSFLVIYETAKSFGKLLPKVEDKEKYDQTITGIYETVNDKEFETEEDKKINFIYSLNSVMLKYVEAYDTNIIDNFRKTSSPTLSV